MAAQSNGTATAEVDVVVVGAGMAGLYMLHRMRGLGMSAVALESGEDVGGTWYWNRYPGARCDVQSIDYQYSFDPALEQEWTWSERYATQPEILRYLQFVADKYDLRRDVRFGTRVAQATWDDDAARWSVRTEAGDELRCRFYVMASGCLSMPKELDIPGAERFRGEVYFTSRWPHEGADLTGKRVGVIGTGSSGIQSIPIMAKQAAQLTVFQRTPNFSIPAHNGPVRPEKRAEVERDRAGYRQAAKYSRGGVPGPIPTEPAALVPTDEQQRRMEAAWEQGELFPMLSVFADQGVNEEANAVVAEFIRGKIRAIVKDPETAETLCPKDHPLGTKRPCLDSGYYETFNMPHVRLVDLRKHPISTVTETGIETADETFEFDVIVYATGFDAMTGAIVAVDITGGDGVTLKQKWEHGPKTYLGLTVAGFPNFFTITGPGSPSVLSNMAVSIEQHVDWVADTLERLRRDGFEVIEATEAAESGWVQHVNDYGSITLFPKANSWYMGANVPGKPRVFLPYVGGVDGYRRICDEVASSGYAGFVLRGAQGERRDETIVRRLQPDVELFLEAMAAMNLPELDSMTPDEARAFGEAGAAQRPPGPDVAEIVDGTFPGADGSPLEYRLYRPEGDGPHPVVVYFHGGGWVLGHATSDDPFCRDLCVRSGQVIISANYRHAPEARFPAAADDGFAALRWVDQHAVELGGIPGQLSVAGWSAGGNIAAVVCQLARDAGGPAIAGQLLITPVTDWNPQSRSLEENAEGYMLTRSLMDWFWDHYANEADRTNPKAAPLRGDLHDLPPAMVVTSEFDPLRDEGDAYAAALSAAGVPVEHIPCRGHTHTSLTAVDVLPTGAPVRERMAEALRSFARTSVDA